MSIDQLSVKLSATLSAQFYSRLSKQEGQGIVEYALLVSLVAITLIGSLISLKEIIFNVINNIPFP